MNCGICSLLFSCVNVDGASQYSFLCCIRENSKDVCSSAFSQHALVLWGLHRQTDLCSLRGIFVCSTSATLRRRHDNDNLFLHMFLFTSTLPSPVIPPLVMCLQTAFLAEIRIVSDSCCHHTPSLFLTGSLYRTKRVHMSVCPLQAVRRSYFNALLCCHHGNGWLWDEPMQAHVWLSTQRDC